MVCKEQVTSSERLTLEELQALHGGAKGGDISWP